MLAHVAALYDEVSLVLRREKFQNVGAPAGILAFELPASLHGTGVMIVVTGWGAQAAEAGARWTVRELRPSAIVAVGYSGGTRPGLAAGALVIGEQVAQVGTDGPAATTAGDVDSTRTAATGPLAGDGDLLALAHSSAQALRMQVAAGLVGTTPKIVSNPMDKAALGAATGALAIDLETWHLARAAADAGIAFIAVRAIVDAVSDTLPGFVDQLPPGPRPAAALPALKYVIGNPGRLRSVVRAGLAAGRARRTLAQFITEFTARWQASPMAGRLETRR
jgi:nucleoside phosphorylase